MKQPEYPKQMFSAQGLPKGEPSTADKTQLNFFDSDLAQNPIKTLWRHPFGKALLIAGGTFAGLYAGGFLLRAGAYFMGGWNAFKDSSCPPGGSSAVADKH